MNIRDLKAFKHQGRKVTVLTAYDASFAKLLTDCEIDVILIGDSLGMSVAGFKNTLKVTMKQMLYHTECVSRGIGLSQNQNKPLVIADMPWGSFNAPNKALKNAMKFIRSGADMVKIEGASENELISIELLRNNGIPVCGHLGLKPQSVALIGGFIRQGEDEKSAEAIFKQAKQLDELGVEMIVLECIPPQLSEKITTSIQSSVIGIGTYSACDGQVLVIYDVLGISSKQLKFSKNFLTETGSVKKAIESYISEVKNQKFPNSLS